MKTLYIVRHANAEDARPGLADFDRQLNQHGQDQASHAAKILSKNSTKIDLILTSPSARTLATAQIIAQSIQYPIDHIQSNPEMYQASVDDLLEIISHLEDTHKYVMIVGHNPAITQLAMHLSSEVTMELSPGTVIVLAFQQQSWHSAINHSATLLSTIQSKKS